MAEKFRTAEAFLEEVAEQISYRPLRPAIVGELQDHIDQRIEEYQNEGCSRAQAEQKAVAAMGDPVVIGTEINAVRHVRTNPALMVLTAILMLTGLTAAIYMNQMPEQIANGFGYNGFSYYLPGFVVLLMAGFYSYPLIIKHWKRILLYMLAMFLVWVGCLISIEFSNSLYPGLLRYLPIHIPHRGSYFTALILGPLLTVAMYYYRYSLRRLALLLAGAEIWILICAATDGMLSAIAVFVISFSGTLLFMVCKKLFAFKYLTYGLLFLITFLLLPHQKERFRDFTAPQEAASNVLVDAYNSVLIQELLSRAPAIGALSLSPEEMMEYGTGEWYFDNDAHKPYFHYDESTVAFWNILPQHFSNNYLLAVGIFLFGWLFGILCLVVIGAFFVTIFRCVFLIRGKLASCTAFNCAMVLLIQTVLYIAGNLGYQYEYFTNLPLVSEGKISIVINMFLLGFIFSAYRYDRVIDEPVSFRVI